MDFGKSLIQRRKEIGMTAEELAVECGVSRSYITLMENGKRLPSKKIIPRMATALKIKPNVVINWYLETIRKQIESQ